MSLSDYVKKAGLLNERPDIDYDDPDLPAFMRKKSTPKPDEHKTAIDAIEAHNSTGTDLKERLARMSRDLLNSPVIVKDIDTKNPKAIVRVNADNAVSITAKPDKTGVSIPAKDLRGILNRANPDHLSRAVIIHDDTSKKLWHLGKIDIEENDLGETKIVLWAK